SLGVAGAGITSLNRLSTITQSFVNGAAGTAPAFVSAGSAHTLNIPLASTAAVTAGLISKTDYDAFNTKQTSALAAGSMWVGNASGVAQAFALSGDIASVSNTGAVVVNKSTTGTANLIVALDGTSVGTMSGLKLPSGAFNATLTAATTASASYVLRLPAAAPAAGQAMQSDASGNFTWFTPSSGVINNT